MNKLYLMVTTDELELPLIVADSVPELAQKSGASINTIYSMITHHEREGLYQHPKYIKVVIDDEESEGF